jgi:hypothetical protein
VKLERFPIFYLFGLMFLKVLQNQLGGSKDEQSGQPKVISRFSSVVGWTQIKSGNYLLPSLPKITPTRQFTFIGVFWAHKL